MIVFACIFVAAIALAFGIAGLRALAVLSLLGFAAFAIWLGALFVHQQANADQFNRELAASERKNRVEVREWLDRIQRHSQ